MPKHTIIARNEDLPADWSWAARAAWEAKRVLAEADGLDAEIVDWGVGPSGNVLWLNIDTGDFNMDLAVSREFLHYFGFRDQAAKFASHVRRVHPAFFTQNGAGRHIYGQDLEDPDGVEIIYQGQAEIPDFSEQAAAEKAALEAREKRWSAEEKARKDAAKEKAAAAKKAAAAASA